LDEQHGVAAGRPDGVGVLVAEESREEVDLRLPLPRSDRGAEDDDDIETLIGAELVDGPAPSLPLAA
jgi:hypothetical protein